MAAEYRPATHSAGRSWSPPHIRLTPTIKQGWLCGTRTSVWVPRLILKPPSHCALHWLQPLPPLRLSFLLAAAAYKVAQFVHFIVAPLTSKYYNVGGNKLLRRCKAQSNTGKTSHKYPVNYHNRLCKCSINLVLLKSGVTNTGVRFDL